MNKICKFIAIILIFAISISMLNLKPVYAVEETIKVNISDLTMEENGTSSDIKKYKQDDFELFIADYNQGNLPKIYVTEFLFDGVSMVKTYDLDDYTEKGNDVEVKTLSLTVINVNTLGNVEFSGELKGGMIAVNTNGKTGNINMILNGVKLDTDSKKAPAIYVYNKDITYTGCKVTIKTASNTKNYIEGGKFKKVSLVAKEELSNYTNKYSGANQTNYTTFTNYYGVYTTSEINNILFAKVQAASEDLAEGDPYYFYKGAGAISSDIDLYFEGTGYLEVKSKNKEGIETKGNLTFSGGTGDYVVYAYDDCLNTTTKSSNNSSVRNTLTIDVNSLVAVVDGTEDADEGDAIDSNGQLIINGGTIVAIAHPGQDAGLDSESGTVINGGTILATGDMFDSISNQSKQNYAVFSFQKGQTSNGIIALLNEKDEVIMAYKSDRSFSNLVFSSSNLTEGTYKLYKGGEIEGSFLNGFYTKVTKYTKGTEQGFSGNNAGGMFGGMKGGIPGEAPSDMPTDMSNDMGNNKGMMKQQKGQMSGFPGNENTTTEMSNEFKISGVSNMFSGVGDYTSSNSQNSVANTNYVIIISAIAVLVGIAVIILVIKLKKKK